MEREKDFRERRLLKRHHNLRERQGSAVEERSPANSHDQDLAWRQLVESIQGLYPQPLAIGEAEKAAKNLVGFYRTLLAIKRRTEQNRLHEQRR